MTKQRQDQHSTEFGLWLRQQPGLDSRKYGFDSENLDYIWFAYRVGWFITIEEKRYNAKQSVAQKDTHNIIRQLLEFASGINVYTIRGFRKIEYRGHYLVQFENTNPEDSKWIKINGDLHDTNDLIVLLKYGKLINLQKEASQIIPIDLLDLSQKLSTKLELNIDLSLCAKYIK